MTDSTDASGASEPSPGSGKPPPAGGSAAGAAAAQAPNFGAHPGLAFDPAGSPFDTVYGDIFRSRAGAWQEAHGVFVDGCRVRAGWRRAERFCVLELGFGLGVNFLATLAAWRADPERCRNLHFVSVEAHPLARDDLARGLAALSGLDRSPDLPDLLAAWPPALPGLHRLHFAGGAVTLTLAFGEARRMLPRLAMAVDAFYLDGFSPARNPAMWDAGLMRALARHARPGARLATWSAAASVRENLSAAGFSVERMPGIGGKRHRIEATWAPRWPSWPAPAEPPALPRRAAIVVGAGLVGTAVAAGFARRGFSVDLLDTLPHPGGDTARQPLLAEHLHLSPDDNPTARLTRAALLLRQGLVGTASRVDGRSEIVAGQAVATSGRLVVAASDDEWIAFADMLTRLRWPTSFAQCLARDQASELAGLSLPHGGLWLPLCTAQAPARVVAETLAAAGPAVRFTGGTAIASLDFDPGSSEWVACSVDGRRLASAPIAILANAGDAPRLGRLTSLNLRRLRGQTTWLADPAMAGLRTVLSGKAYAAPAGDGRVLVGASFDEGDDLSPDPRDDLGNLRRLGAMIGRDPQALLPRASPAAVGFRFTLPDRLPAIGPLPDETASEALRVQLARNDKLPIPLAHGLYGAFGCGSRGLLWASLAAELLPAMACGEPAPIERDLLAAIAPTRVLRKRLRSGSR